MARRLLDNDRRREQRRQQLLQDRISRRAERLIATEIIRTTRQIVADWEANGRIAKPPEHERRMWVRLNSVWRTSIEAMGSRIIEQGKSAGMVDERKEVGEDVYDRMVRDYITQVGGVNIAEDISETTVAHIVEQVAIGSREGLGQREIAKKITSNVTSIGRARAAVIARTETHSAGNFGALESARETGLPMRKEWISSGGGRTREDHAEADGQTVLMDEPFVVGGEELMYPGDPSGSARQVVNCRCATGYIVED